MFPSTNYGKPYDINQPIGNPTGKFSWFDHSKFGGKIYEPQQPIARTTEPIVTGTSVLAIKYKDGVAIAADTLASYGSLARFRDLQRVHKISKDCVISASGEYSDFQYVLRMLDELITENDIADTPLPLSPSSIHSYLTRVLYGRRNKFDPLWGNFVVAGFKDGKPFLGSADLLGTNYEDDHIATGYGDYMARPLLRNGWKPDLTKDEAIQLLKTCMRVLYYRDARALNKIQIATVDADGAQVGAPIELDTDWSVAGIAYSYDGSKTKANVNLNAN